MLDAKAIAYRAIELGAMQKQDELEQLLEVLIARRPRRVLEIGCFMGGTLYAWRQLGADVVGVDQVVHKRFTGHGAEVVIADSHDPSTFLEVRQLVDAVDFLFIDGDHRYDGVKQDYTWYRALLATSALVGFHDICVSPDPDMAAWKVWRELSGRKREILRPPVTWGGIGLLEA